ncbi:unnamed protein product, partial [Iphiclides podalirius]
MRKRLRKRRNIRLGGNQLSAAPSAPPTNDRPSPRGVTTFRAKRWEWNARRARDRGTRASNLPFRRTEYRVRSAGVPFRMIGFRHCGRVASAPTETGRADFTSLPTAV